jgi:hypothetical protein
MTQINFDPEWWDRYTLADIQFSDPGSSNTGWGMPLETFYQHIRARLKHDDGLKSEPSYWTDDDAGQEQRQRQGKIENLAAHTPYSRSQVAYTYHSY